MATFVRLPSGSWRVQIRRKNRYATRTFQKREDAEAWSLALEREIDLKARKPPDWGKCTFEKLIDLYLQDMLEAGKDIGKGRRGYLESIRPSLGKLKLSKFDRKTFIEYGRARAKEAPLSVRYNFTDLGAVLSYAEAAYRVPSCYDEFEFARIALRKLGLMGRSRPRTRRPTVDELQRLTEFFKNNSHRFPMDRVIEFAIATAMRQGEIFRIEWADVDLRERLITIRDRKSPHDKKGNDEVVPMLNLTGYDAWQLLLEQKILTRGKGRVFPYSATSAATAFNRACTILHIENLRFHDLRREAATRLFEAGLSIERVALVTGHKNWEMLRRYTRLKPEDLVRTEPPVEVSVTEFMDQLLNL